MKKLLNTLYVTSENSYLGLDEKILLFLKIIKKRDGFRYIIWRELFHLAIEESVLP